MPGRIGDSATVVIVPWVSAPELSRVTPPVRRVLMIIRAESLVELLEMKMMMARGPRVPDVAH